MLKTNRLIAVLVVVLGVTLPACRPGEPNADEPANSGCEAEACGKEQPKVAPAKEEAYPYQVNAELARVYLKYNINDEAMRLFDLAIQQQMKQTNSQDAENWVGLGEALQKAGNREEAVAAYQRAGQIYEALLKQAETTQLYNFYLGRLAVLSGVLGDDEGRKAYLTKLKAEDDNALQQVELAGVLQQIGQIEKAEQHYKRALELTAEEPGAAAEVKVAYAKMLFSMERFEDALPLAKEAKNTDEANEETRANARRLVFELYEATGEADKLEFKD